MSRLVELDYVFLCYAFRYALGRRTYVVNDVYRALEKYWDVLPAHTKENIQKEIREAINYNNAGDDCDKKQWETILRWRVNE